MPILYLLEQILAALTVVFFVTQILIPFFLGRPFFPTFRRGQRAVVEELEEAKEDLDQARTWKTIREIHKETTAVNKEERDDEVRN